MQTKLIFKIGEKRPTTSSMKQKFRRIHAYQVRSLEVTQAEEIPQLRIHKRGMRARGAGQESELHRAIRTPTKVGRQPFARRGILQVQFLDPHPFLSSIPEDGNPGRGIAIRGPRASIRLSATCTLLWKSNAPISPLARPLCAFSPAPHSSAYVFLKGL